MPGRHDAGPAADPYHLVEAGLRQWFEMDLRSVSGLRVVPSIVVHAAWQEFMRDPGSYSAFCASALGYDLPSVPALDVVPGEPPAGGGTAQGLRSRPTDSRAVKPVTASR